MKGIKKCRGIFVVILVIALVTSWGMPLNWISYADGNGISGSSRLAKEAVETGVNEWGVTLSVFGDECSKTSDIVLVIDCSRSMSYYDNTMKTRIEKSKTAAIEFVRQMMAADGNTRIAVVTFQRTASTVLPFSADSSLLIKAIDSIKADYSANDKVFGGTNLQAGLHNAAELLLNGGSAADLKVVLLIGDGEPTHSYEFIGSGSVELESCETEGNVHKPIWNDSGLNEYYNYSNEHISGFGNNYLLTEHSYFVEKECPNNSSVIHKYVFPENHGTPALYEANLLKGSGVNVYSVGIDVVSDGKDVLKKCQNSGYYSIDSSNSVYDFSDISNALCSEDYTAVVIDKIGSEFDLITPGSISVTYGEAFYDPEKREIKWIIGDLDQGVIPQMSYPVKAKEGIIFKDGEDNRHPTNETATIEYKPVSGPSIISDFPVPYVPLTGGAVLLKAISTDQDGNPINEAGDATDYEGAYNPEGKVSRYPNSPDSFIVYGNCNVSQATLGTIPGYEYKGYDYVLSDGTIGRKVNDPAAIVAEVFLTPENNSPVVYFKYYKSEQETEPGNGDGGNGDGGNGDGGNGDSGNGNSGGENGGDNSSGGSSGIPAATTTDHPELNKTDHFAYIIGYPDGLVRPLGSITREEVAVIFYRLLTDESRKAYFSVMQPFHDVESLRWSNNEIATLYNAKIIQGDIGGNFHPGTPITRAEFACIAARFDQLEDAEGKFSDIENHWAKSYINSSAEKGWINGYGDGTFRPNHIIIRCEAMKLINEVLDRRVNSAVLHKDTIQWPDNTIDKWYYEIVLEATNTHDYERENKPKSIERWTRIKDNPVW
ncbi:MAG: S-layer homology domain-containing protein [Eubacteriales bacterium]|nr:S-layer homology domain-containing protein [Eubacteriales bacterium]MDD4630080.1 S-layer homology domain-containing protein [Eubacteriales bacterium]